MVFQVFRYLKLVCTNFNYRVLISCTAAIFLSNEYSLYAPIYLGWTSCMILFVWGQSTVQQRVESDKIQNEKFLLTVGLETSSLRFEVWCSTDLDTQTLMKDVLFKLPIYIHVLPTLGYLWTKYHPSTCKLNRDANCFFFVECKDCINSASYE